MNDDIDIGNELAKAFPSSLTTRAAPPATKQAVALTDQLRGFAAGVTQLHKAVEEFEKDMLASIAELKRMIGRS